MCYNSSKGDFSVPIFGANAVLNTTKGVFIPMKKLYIASALMLCFALMAGSLSGCSLLGSDTEETTAPYIESVSELVNKPTVKLEKLDKGEKMVVEAGTKAITADMLEGKTLISIEIPESVNQIDNEAISKDTIIICHDNTFAADYASENGYWYYLTYIELDENNHEVEKQALYSNENKPISEAYPANSMGILKTLDGEVFAQDEGIIVNYFNGLVKKARADRPYIAYSRNYSVDDIKFEAADENNASVKLLNSSAKQLRNLILKGAKTSEFMPVPEHVEYGADSSSSFTIGELLYTEAMAREETVSCYCTELDVLYRLTINLGNYNDVEMLNSVFGCIPKHDMAVINQEFDKLSSYLEIDDNFDIVTKDCSIFAESDRTSDCVSTIRLSKVSYITAKAHGVGAFEGLSDMTVTLKFTDTYTIGFDWTAPIE